jgi:hypothetical protein
MIRGCTELRNEEFRNLYFSSSKNYNNKVKEKEMDRACSAQGRGISYTIFIANAKGKGTLYYIDANWSIILNWILKI